MYGQCSWQASGPLDPDFVEREIKAKSELVRGDFELARIRRLLVQRGRGGRHHPSGTITTQHYAVSDHRPRVRKMDRILWKANWLITG